MAAIGWKITITDIIKKAKRHEIVGCMGSIAVHND
jgi:hypothetical protein